MTPMGVPMQVGVGGASWGTISSHATVAAGQGAEHIRDMDAPRRDLVFISYSHLDREWLERLLVFLKPYRRRGTVEVRADPWIQVGQRWRREIGQALERTAVAVFLTSPDFLDSDFIIEEEIPPLLEAADGGAVVVACVPVSACGHHVPLPIDGRDVLLTEYQWARDPNAPLDALEAPTRNRALVEIADAIVSAARTVIPDSGTAPPGASKARGGRPVAVLRPDATGEPSALHGIPPLPPHYLERPEILEPMRHALLSGESHTVGLTGASVKVGLHGLGGIGKTALAVALARDADVRRTFPDGIIWLSVGQEPEHVRPLGDVGKALGQWDTAWEDTAQARAELTKLVANRSFLLVLDDVWDVRDVWALDVTGEASRLLITTRDASILTALGAVEHGVEVLPEQAALELLGEWAGEASPGLPPEARRVAEECGYLPLALALAGARVRQGLGWSRMAEALSYGRLTFLDHPYGSVFASMQLSVDALPAGVAERYAELAVFPEDVAVPEQTVAKLWARTAGSGDYETAELLADLHAKSLLRFEEDEAARTLRLHDLQRDYLRLIADDVTALHRKLLEGHEPALQWNRSEGGRPWHRLPEDEPYLWQHLARHLVEAALGDELRALLLDSRWLEAKLSVVDLPSTLADFRLLSPSDPVQTIAQALRLSAHCVADDPHHSPASSWGGSHAGKRASRHLWKGGVPCGTRPG